MSETKTTLELARVVEEEYAKVDPFMQALNNKVDEVFTTIRNFIKNNNWHSREGKFYWVTMHYSVRIDINEITPEGIYFGGNGWDDDDYLSFEDMDNIDAVLIREFDAFTAELNAQNAEYTARKRAQLEAELAKLND